MPTGGIFRRRLFALAVLFLALFGPSTVSRAQSDSSLIVDNEHAANPDLVDSDLVIPDGFGWTTETMRVPAGFTVTLIGAGLDAPRFTAFDSAGNLLVADQGRGEVYRYPANGSGSIDPAESPPETLISDLNAPSNVAFHDVNGTTYLYVGEESQITRYAYDPAQPVGDGEVVIPDLPENGHGTRTIAFGSDGKLYLAIGSSCNICNEDDPRRAAIVRYNDDGSGEEIFASGLRNPVGVAFQPGTDTLWAAVNERDNQGNEIPPDLVTIVTQGANYGWPDCQPPDATPQEDDADCSNITPPTIGIQAHSAPLGIAFATGTAFPEEFQGGLFVVQHGSWNRDPPAEPKIMYVTFQDGKPTAVKDFITGWQRESGDRWGRPVGVTVAPNGSLIVSDDDAGVLYRVDYTG
jgi:glucose/arabinose dehydrogenase